MSDLTFPPGIQAMFDDPAYWVSNRHHRLLSDEFDARFRSALAGAVECEPHLTARFLDQHGPLVQLPWLAWDDDPDGGYWIASGITHEWREPEDEWETFMWGHYLNDKDGTERIADEQAFFMTPHVTRDARAVAELVMRGLRDHRARSSSPTEGQ